MTPAAPQSITADKLLILRQIAHAEAGARRDAALLRLFLPVCTAILLVGSVVAALLQGAAS